MITDTAAMADWQDVNRIAVSNFGEPGFGSVGTWDREEAVLLADVPDVVVARSVSELDAGQGRDLRTALDEIRSRHFPKR